MIVLASKWPPVAASQWNCVQLLNCFLFSLCESQGVNTRKRGRRSHMLRLIYLKVFAWPQTLNAWTVSAWVWRIPILDFLALVSCGGLCYFQHIEEKEKQPDLWLHKFAFPAALDLCSSAYSRNFIFAGLHIDHNDAFDAHPSYRPCKRQSLVNVANWSPSIKYGFSTFIKVWVCSLR